MVHVNSPEEFFELAEQAATEFRARYGVTGGWSDAQINRALADAGWPALNRMPSGPRGRNIVPGITPKVLSAREKRLWRRENAMHLLGHTMIHDSRRCAGCQDW